MNLSRLSFDINYFDIIDDPKKAYWLGFLSADGSLKNNRVSLCLSDKDHVEKFKSDLKSEHKIGSSHVLDKRTNKIYISHYIQITNKFFTEKLSKLVPIEKSIYFTLPKIDEKYMSNFLAGMLDGDGSFTLRKKENYLMGTLISTKECLEEIQEILFVNFGIEKTKLIQVTNKEPNVWKLYIYNGTMLFLDFIYGGEDKTMYLSRKYLKYRRIKRHLLDNPNKQGNQRRPINVYDETGLLIDTLDSVKECVKKYKMSTSTLFDRLKNGKPYKNMTFVGQEMVKY